jgi:predicted NUDIX family NTP pyrophosphohydrolase
MPTRQSAGILLYRFGDTGEAEVLIAHMGGPFWQRKDAGAWSIPKGEHGADEDPLACARREFAEELGLPVPPGEVRSLGTVIQSGGKSVTVWAVHGDLDPDSTVSNTFEMEWPRGSGVMRTFPEVDRVAWVDLAQARTLLVAGQVAFVDRLAEALGAG